MFTEFFNDVRGGEIPNFRVRTYARTWICQALSCVHETSKKVNK